MNLQEIKDAVRVGKTVCWSSDLYEVKEVGTDYFIIVCNSNESCIGLTWKDGKTLTGKEEEFFIK